MMNPYRQSAAIVPYREPPFYKRWYYRWLVFRLIKCRSLFGCEYCRNDSGMILNRILQGETVENIAQAWNGIVKHERGKCHYCRDKINRYNLGVRMGCPFCHRAFEGSTGNQSIDDDVEVIRVLFDENKPTTKFSRR